MRHTARELRHRVLALGGQHPRAKRLGALEILDGNGGLRAELLHELGVVRAQTPRIAGGDLHDANETVARHERRAQHAPFPQVVGAVRRPRCSRAAPRGRQRGRPSHSSQEPPTRSNPYT